MEKFWQSIFLIALGAVCLLVNFGAVSWLVIWRFWPLILILAGIKLIKTSQYQNKKAAILIGIIMVAVIIIAVNFKNLVSLTRTGSPSREVADFYRETFPRERRQEFSLTKNDYPNLKERAININLSLGRLKLEDQADRQELFLNHSCYQDPFGYPQQKTSLTNQNQTLVVDFNNYYPSKTSLSPEQIHAIFYQIVLGQTDLATAINLEVTQSEADINLSKLKLTALSLMLNSGEINLQLTRNCLPQEKIIINLVEGNCYLSLPSEIAINLHYQLTGSGQINAGGEIVPLEGSTGTIILDQNNQKGEIIIEANIVNGNLAISRQEPSPL